MAWCHGCRSCYNVLLFPCVIDFVPKYKIHYNSKSLIQKSLMEIFHIISIHTILVRKIWYGIVATKHHKHNALQLKPCTFRNNNKNNQHVRVHPRPLDVLKPFFAFYCIATSLLAASPVLAQPAWLLLPLWTIIIPATTMPVQASLHNKIILAFSFIFVQLYVFIYLDAILV